MKAHRPARRSAALETSALAVIDGLNYSNDKDVTLTIYRLAQ
ncbi:MAG: hypothetical protein R3C58_02120 [Parvularculaceae bacterium]